MGEGDDAGYRWGQALAGAWRSPTTLPSASLMVAISFDRSPRPGPTVTDLSQDPVFVQPFLDSWAGELGARAGQQDPCGVEIAVGFVWVA